MKRLFIIMCLSAVSFAAFANDTNDTEEVVPFDRGIGISRSVFIPKGTFSVGASFSYSTFDVGNGADDAGFKALFGLVNGLSGNLVTGGVSPYGSYFVMDNLAVGGRFNFKRTSYGIGSANLSISDISFGVSNMNYMKDSYSGAVFARYFIPFGDSRRFAMFAELAASGGYAEAQSYSLNEYNEKNGTYQNIYDFEIGVIPGICAFVTNSVALEISVGLVGLNYQKVIQRTNQIETSVMESSGANYKINLLNINFGISLYIPTGAHSVKKLNKYKARINEKANM